MTNFLVIAVGAVFLLAAGMPLAQDAKAPASTPGAVSARSGSAMNMSSQMGRMDEHMKRMQALHEKVMSATTPEERQKAMEEQRNEMRSGMEMMNEMMPGHTMMGSTGGKMMAEKGKPADANAQMRMMQKRMEMMQMMMQTMMDQQGMTVGAGGGATATKP